MTRDVQLLMSARIFMSAARALAGILVPIYLAQNGYSATTLGYLFAAVALASAAMTTSTGVFSGRYGRKIFIICVPMLAAIAAVAFALSTAILIIFVFAALGSFGRGGGAGGGNIGPYQPVEQALLADSTPNSNRNSVFARLAFASSMGALIGSQLARIPDLGPSFGLSGNDAYRPAFILIAVLATIAGLLAVPVQDHTHEATKVKGKSAPLLTLPRRSWPVLSRLWLVNGLNGISMGFLGPFLTYWFFTRYGAGPGTIGLLYSIVNIAAMGSNLSAAAIAERLGLVNAVTFGRGLQAILLVLMVLMPSFWLAGFVYTIRMVSQRLAMPLRQSYVMAVTDPTERASVAALSNMPAQATSVAGPPVAGYLFEHAPLFVPFQVAAVVQILSSGAFYAFFRNIRPPEERVRLVEDVTPEALPEETNEALSS
jgi:MFS family permease